MGYMGKIDCKRPVEALNANMRKFPAANPQSYDKVGVAMKPKKKERGDAR